MTESNFKQIFAVLANSKIIQKPDSFNQSPLYKDWAQVAGSPISDNTSQLKIEKSVLHVSVKSSTWAHELINQQNTILEGLRDKGHKNLTEMSIRIRVPKPIRRPVAYKKTNKIRKISPKLQKLFARLASESSNPDTKETFLRLSRKRTED